MALHMLHISLLCDQMKLPPSALALLFQAVFWQTPLAGYSPGHMPALGSLFCSAAFSALVDTNAAERPPLPHRAGELVRMRSANWGLEADWQQTALHLLKPLAASLREQ